MSLAQFFKKYIQPPYSVFACLNGIKTEPHTEKFTYINTENIKDHGTKLNLLADKILKQANDDDLILFVDGDAFPVADIRKLADENLDQYPHIEDHLYKLENQH